MNEWHGSRYIIHQCSVAVGFQELHNGTARGTEPRLSRGIKPRFGLGRQVLAKGNLREHMVSPVCWQHAPRSLSVAALRDEWLLDPAAPLLVLKGFSVTLDDSGAASLSCIVAGPEGSVWEGARIPFHMFVACRRLLEGAAAQVVFSCWLLPCKRVSVRQALWSPMPQARCLH